MASGEKANLSSAHWPLTFLVLGKSEQHKEQERLPSRARWGWAGSPRCWPFLLESQASLCPGPAWAPGAGPAEPRQRPPFVCGLQTGEGDGEKAQAALAHAGPRAAT